MMRTVPVMALVLVTGLMLCLPVHMDATTVAPSERLGNVESTSNTVVKIMSALPPGEWTEMHPASAPSPRMVNWMAYDSVSDKVILFGGRFEYYGGYNETWAYDFDTDTWTNMNPPVAPSIRWAHAMAYDSQSNRVILFGGSNQLEQFNDTWAFNYEQNEWTNMNPIVAPSPRADFGMVYDSQSDRVILFGGYAGYDIDETWSYDFETNSWTNMNPASRPPARFTPAIAYDIQSDRVLIFGGIGGGLRDDMWAYDFESNTWTEMHPAVRPPPSYGTRFSYDSHADRIVMFGGDDPNPPYYRSDTWTYDFDADVWTKIDVYPRPFGRSYQGMAYDSRSARSIIFGGAGIPMVLFNDTWAFLELVAHDPILIDGNAEFTDANGVVAGGGTESDPYVIVGWDVSASTANGIEIRNTDAHFIIRDCYIHDGLSQIGIYLSNCVNGTLEDNTCLNNAKGVYLLSSSNNTFSNNTCISNNGYGICLDLGSGNRIWNNTFCYNNGAGDSYDPAHVQALDSSSGTWWNSTDGHGNYWSDWTTPDVAPPDGIVDVPYDIAGSAGAKDYYPRAGPSCTITSPTSGLTYSTNLETVDLGGTASDNIEVTSVTWKNMATGSYGTASGTTSWSINGIPLNAGSNLIYVNATDAAGNKGSDTIIVRCLLTAPRNLQAIPGDGSIVLSWETPHSDGGSPITGYRIYRSNSSGSEEFLIEIGNTLTYADTGLTNDMTYYYRISAVNSVGEGPLSTEALATPYAVTWPMFRQNAQHTGLSPYDTAANAGRLLWSITTDSWMDSSPAIGVDGTVYVGSMDGYLYAINGDGTLRWKFGTSGGIHSSPAISANGIVYVGSRDSNLYAVNPDGSYRWSFYTSDWVDSSPTIGPDGTIYVGSEDRNLYAINSDGSLRWKLNFGWWVDSSPAIADDGTIYVGCEDGNLYAIDAGGTVLWEFTTGGSVQSSPAIADDGTIYVGSTDHNLYAIYPNGSLRWSHTTGYGITSSPAIGSDGTVYVGSKDYSIYALWPNGTLRWSFYTGMWVESSPAIGADGIMYVGSSNNYLYAINPDGSVRWILPTGGSVRSSPSIGMDGIVYVASADHDLYAVGGVLKVPSAAQGLQAVAGDLQVALSWEAPLSDGNSTIAGYRLYRGASPGGESLLVELGNVLSYTDTGVTNGVTYYYQVSAVNVVGEGPRSSEVWATPTAPPTCTIDSPASDPFYTTSTAVDLSGTASDDIEVMSVTWSNAATGASGTATGTTTWDIAHISLDSGSNVITVTSHDNSGLTGTDTITVIRDNANPVCTITIPAVDPYYTNSAAVSLSGTASDNTEVIGVTWINAATGESGTAPGTTSWAISGITLNAGSNLIHVNSTDAAGNHGIDTITVVRDNTAPTCTITSPTSLATYNTATSTTNLGGTSSDDILIAQVSWKNMATGSSGTASGTTTWSIAGISLNAGGNLIYVNSTDEAGNQGSDTISVIRDSVAPTCAITSPTSLSTYNIAASTIDLGGTASDNIAVTQVTWKNLATGLSGTATGTTTWAIIGISLNAGSNLVYVNASDAAGNVGSDTITVTRDSTAPTCTITSPTSDSTYSTSVATLDLSGTASDNIDVSTVNWSNAATGASATASGTTSWTITGIALDVGSNLVTVTAHDAAGNTGSDTITVIYTPLAELTVNGTASPTSGTKTLSVSFTCTPSGGASPYTYFWVFGDGGTSTLKDPSHAYDSTGTFTVTVTVTDSASDTAQWNVTVTVTSGGGTSWLPIIVVGIVAAFAVAIALTFLMRRRS
jgi:parallel beta-helix repeat protein